MRSSLYEMRVLLRNSQGRRISGKVGQARLQAAHPDAVNAATRTQQIDLGTNMNPIEIVCGSCDATMRLSEELMQRVQGHAGRVTCKRCAAKIGLDARGPSPILLSGGRLLQIASATARDLDLDPPEMRKSLISNPRFSEFPTPAEDAAPESAASPESTASPESAPAPEIRVSLAPPIPEAVKREREASRAVRHGDLDRDSAGPHVIEAPAPPGFEADSLTPHTWHEAMQDEGERLHLPADFKSSPMSSNVRDESFRSLYPQTASAPLPAVVPQESRFAQENRRRVPRAPGAGELKQPVAAESVRPLPPPEEQGSNWGPWALAAAACVGLLVNVATGPSDQGVAGMIGNLWGNNTAPAPAAMAAAAGYGSPAPSLSHPSLAPLLVVEASPAGNWVELLPEDQTAQLVVTERIKTLEKPAETRAEPSSETAPSDVVDPQASPVVTNPPLPNEVEEHLPFSSSAAAQAMRQASIMASRCRREGDPTGEARIQITFAGSGKVTSATVSGPPFAGTATGSCIAEQFRKAQVPEFSGNRVSLTKTLTIQ